MFRDFDFDKELGFDKENKKQHYNKKNTNYNKKSSKTRHNKEGNEIRGGHKLDIWKSGDLVIKAKPINTDELKESKIITFTNHIANGPIPDNKREAILDIFKQAKSSGYKMRSVCDAMQPLLRDILEIFSKYNTYIIVPWSNYCSVGDKNIPLYMPTDDNIELAAYYFKGYHKLPGSIRAKLAAVATSLTGLRNNELTSILVTYDPYYKGKDYDFKNSKTAVNFYILANKLGISIYNMAIDEHVKSLEKLLK